MVEFGGSFGRYGTGSYIRSLPKRSVLHFQNFSGGYFSATNRKEVPENTSPFAIDFEVTKGNRLRRSPGTTILEELTGHEPIKFLVHGSLDFTSELVFFDPPYFGVKRIGPTEWANRGLVLNNEGWFAWVNFGGTLIFSDGSAVYARQVNDGTVLSVVAEAPIAVSYESWAGRVWAGGAIIDENFEQLGLVWSAANSDYTDWTGEGAGFELLLDAISAGDRLIRLKSMGLDFMAVMLRKSIWVVRRTGQLDRPGDPQPRVAGKGAVNHDVVQSTNKGIVYLSDDGVELFDGNSSEKISLQIDAELLPLDYGAILEYSSSYDSIRNRYYLHDPRGTTWIYDIAFSRWFRRTLVALGSVEWPLQSEGAIVEGAPRMVFLGDQIDESTAPRTIAEEDQDSEENFGVPLTPIWITKPVARQKINELMTSQLFNIEYVGAADIEIWSPNNEGEYDLLIQESLIPKAALDVVAISAGKTGRLTSLMLRLSAGDIEISDLQVVDQERGPRVAIGAGGLIGNFPDRTTLLDFPIGQAWYMRTVYGPKGPPAPGDWEMGADPTDDFTYLFSLGGADEPLAEVTEYVWDFGDGETETTTVPTVEHVYAAAGTYQPSVSIGHEGWLHGWGNYLYGPLEVEEPPESEDPVEYLADLDSGTIYSGDVAPFSFAQARAGDGLLLPTSDLQVDISLVDAGPDGWSLGRGYLCFDAALLPAVPTSGYVRLEVDGVNEENELGGLGAFTVSLQIFQKALPNNPLSDADWDASTGSHVLASDNQFNLAFIGGEPFVDFVLNAAGLAHVEAERIWFMLVFNYDRLNTDPGWNGPALDSANAAFADPTNFVDQEPILHLEFD